MNILKTIAYHHNRHRQRKLFLQYEGARNAGCQMMEDAFCTFPNRLEAIMALKQMLAAAQDDDENFETAAEFNRIATQQRHGRTGFDVGLQ